MAPGAARDRPAYEDVEALLRDVFVGQGGSAAPSFTGERQLQIQRLEAAVKLTAAVEVLVAERVGELRRAERGGPKPMGWEELEALWRRSAKATRVGLVKPVGFRSLWRRYNNDPVAKQAAEADRPQAGRPARRPAPKPATAPARPKATPVAPPPTKAAKPRRKPTIAGGDSQPSLFG